MQSYEDDERIPLGTSLSRPYSYGSLRIPVRQKLRELTELVRMSASAAFRGGSFEDLFADILEYRQVLHQYGAQQLDEAKVFEIGCGQRGDRLISLISSEVDASGVDIDSPLLEGSADELLAILRTNGPGRLARSLVRHLLFDSLHRKRLERALTQRGLPLTIAPERFLTCDASSLILPPTSVDLIISEDVFEHIKPESLRSLVERMTLWLKPSGLALIRPDVFTGIQGGHLAEWFSLEQTRTRRSEPWEHLRKKRFKPRVYLNELTRSHYREIFSRAFLILEERVRHPNLGMEFLTPAVADELRNYPEEELFSNRVLFILKPLPARN